MDHKEINEYIFKINRQINVVIQYGNNDPYSGYSDVAILANSSGFVYLNLFLQNFINDSIKAGSNENIINVRDYDILLNYSKDLDIVCLKDQYWDINIEERERYINKYKITKDYLMDNFMQIECIEVEKKDFIKGTEIERITKKEKAIIRGTPKSLSRLSIAITLFHSNSHILSFKLMPENLECPIYMPLNKPWSEFCNHEKSIKLIDSSAILYFCNNDEDILDEFYLRELYKKKFPWRTPPF